jgi:dolichyl-diphosphooligosaccharide--protein glycosyltransferase
MIFVPVGFYYCLNHKVTYGKLFVGIYGVLSTYFSCVMIRLMLVIAPAACVLAAIGVSEILRKMSKSIRLHFTDFNKEVEEEDKEEEDKSAKKSADKKQADKRKPLKKKRIPFDVAICVVAFFVYFLSSYVYHSTYIAAEAYSSPSIIMASKRQDGTRVIIDDYREAYYWLKMNTKKDAKILSWWDYGYQITGMGNRTVLVDNNTWNNTHIATVGRVIISFQSNLTFLDYGIRGRGSLQACQILGCQLRTYYLWRCFLLQWR